ncbi:alpha/beta fold hydrolase [Streptomyces variegatus]|uniref:alpha/beta fold hydrolase n=1 Tax=Streptomyces variegatus TaxID=284040 RepID=UPI003C2E9F2F
MPTMNVNGAVVAYTDSGQPADHPDAPTIVFGHGLLFSGWMFHPQIATLRHRFRCIAIDWRGQGETPPTADGFDMDSLAADAVSMIKALDVGPVHWVGLSMGGFIGQRIAARHADLLKTLTLIDTSASSEGGAKSLRYKSLAWAFRAAGARPLIRRVKPILFSAHFLRDPRNAPLLETWVNQLTSTPRIGIYRAVRGVTDRSAVDEEIGSIEIPTLILVGANDVITPPKRSEDIRDRIRGARLEIIPDCGHTSTLEQPATVTRLLSDFLDEFTAPGR